MTGSIYKNGVFYGEPNMSVKYYDNPQDYYILPKAEREAMTELVILNEDDNPLDASLITYGDGSVAEALDGLKSGTTNWTNLVGQPFIIPEAVQDFETSFNSATGYSNITITCNKYYEYGLYMFKHSNALDSYGIMFSRGLGSFGGAVLIKRQANGTWYFRPIL